MAKKAKDILLAAGYTEAEINDPAMATLLGSPKFIKALEAESALVDEAIAEQQRIQKELDGDLEWYQTKVAPTMKKLTEDATNAEARAAAAEARLKKQQEYGLAKIAEQEGGDKGIPKAESTVVVDPKTGNYVTKEALDTSMSQAIGQVGDIMQMVADIPFDHRDLFGQPLPGGIAGLRKSYREAVERSRFRGSLQDFWEQTYKVPEKRAEVQAAAHQKELDDYAAGKVKERETQLISQYGNPQTRPMATSRSPFTNRGSIISGQSAAQANAKPTEGAPGAKPQPWEKTPEQRSQQRIVNFVQRQMEKSA